MKTSILPILAFVIPTVASAQLCSGSDPGCTLINLFGKVIQQTQSKPSPDAPVERRPEINQIPGSDPVAARQALALSTRFINFEQNLLQENLPGYSPQASIRDVFQTISKIESSMVRYEFEALGLKPKVRQAGWIRLAINWSRAKNYLPDQPCDAAAYAEAAVIYAQPADFDEADQAKLRTALLPLFKARCRYVPALREFSSLGFDVNTRFWSNDFDNYINSLARDSAREQVELSRVKAVKQRELEEAAANKRRDEEAAKIKRDEAALVFKLASAPTTTCNGLSSKQQGALVKDLPKGFALSLEPTKGLVAAAGVTKNIDIQRSAVLIDNGLASVWVFFSPKTLWSNVKAADVSRGAYLEVVGSATSVKNTFGASMSAISVACVSNGDELTAKRDVTP